MHPRYAGKEHSMRLPENVLPLNTIEQLSVVPFGMITKLDPKLCLRSRSVICNRIVKHADIGIDDIIEVKPDAAGCIVVKDVILDVSSKDIAIC